MCQIPTFSCHIPIILWDMIIIIILIHINSCIYEITFGINNKICERMENKMTTPGSENDLYRNTNT